MGRTTLKSVLGCAMFLLAAAVPSSAMTLSVVPAHPVEGTPFILAIGLVGSCPFPAGIIATPGYPGIVTVTRCSTAARAYRGRTGSLPPGSPTWRWS